MNHTYPMVIALQPMMDLDAGLCTLQSVDVWLDMPSDKKVMEDVEVHNHEICATVKLVGHLLGQPYNPST